MAATVYILCFLTSLCCAVFLLRGFTLWRSRLLLWSGLCFVGLAINNGLLFVDRVLLPDQSLFWWRVIPVLVGLSLLLYGLIWEGP